MSRREQAILGLLERYEDLVSPLLQGGARGATGVLLMPPTYTDSVRELERLLVKMRDGAARELWWHVREHFLACEWVTRDVYVRRKGKNGKHASVLERRLERVRDESDPRLVEQGIAWLAEAWGLAHEPMLPSLALAGV